ncbi:PolC-type DNA polymerase III [Streptomyces sp. NPDC056486]|uniref:3'-5' exonuclease n=1 Tax=Streptomyces sp. NPDC056486 TaxID=3345835 RepID=UPI0036B58D30
MDTVTHLAHDADYLKTTFHVIDFEGATPTGYSPEPIEVAVIGLHHTPQDGPQPSGFRWESLMRPPAHAPVTPADTMQMGISAQDIENSTPAAEVLAHLDADLPRAPAVLVAHSASVEAGFLYRYRTHCPRMAMLPVLDTIRMAKLAHPDLPAYNLDALIGHFSLPYPPKRHRAMADVEVTMLLFQRLLTDLAQTRTVTTLADLLKRCAKPPKAAEPEQLTFG